ncbi:MULTISPECIES: extracellular solute-binding protein [unclassified Neisseria]|uniref:extracellular solute-binding protein n=1 Tax=unclassified Neisseria TaxID=2623750 RepID=UPI0010719A42|nr:MULTISPECIES: extracellular solute-binding protein [unclassified Neisseria]MBF0804654.1 ABC transporter substrate-binding protein [Neisseria sp. 19428wB4_WF04]TFU40322.1 ABC transporter substrate-binding protein [Neisseria sp. WF04]
MKIFSALILLFAAAHAYAAHGLALGQPVRHPAGFKSFDYVNPEAPKGGTFTLPAAGGFDTFNPFTLKGSREAGMAMLTLDTLAEKGKDEPFAIYGLLAQDISPASDGLSVTFKINPKARFHNGDPVQAKDVAASFNTLTRDKAAVPMYRFYWADVARVETPDMRTVVFRFKKRNAELHMTLGELPVFSHKSYPKGLAAAPNTPPIGSGPYRFNKADSGRLSEFVRDKNYWAQNLPVRKGMYNFDTVRFKYYKDDTVRLEGIKGGQYDFMQENSARNWARAYPEELLAKRRLRKHEWRHSNTAGMQGFVMNLRRAPFNDIRVRQALVESFDFENTNARLFYGLYRRSNSFFTHSEMAASGKPSGMEAAMLERVRRHLPAAVFAQNAPEPPKTDPVHGIRPNLRKARALLEQAGYRYRNGVLVNPQGRPLVVEFLSPSKTYERVTTKWRNDLAKIGVRMNVRMADPSVYRKRVGSFDFDMTVVVYANSQSPGNEQFDYFSCASAKAEGSHNWAGVCDPAVEALLKHFESFETRTELVAASRALDRVLRHQYIVVPNWYTDRYRVVYRNTLGIPARQPKYYTPAEWALSAGWVKR